MDEQKLLSSSREKRKGFFPRLFTSRYFPLMICGLALLLALPALTVGWLGDDHFIRLCILGSDAYPEIFASPWDIYEVWDGDPDRTMQMIDHGVFTPWWTWKDIQCNFCRPASVLTHLLDYQLWPDSPAFMHAQSVCWYVLIVLTATLLYRRFLGVTVAAGLAALCFAFDDTHGFAVGYMAGRNVLLYIFFGLLALVTHDSWRRQSWRPGAWIGPVLFILSLLSHEAGITTCAYLFAYALFIDRGPWLKRLLTLLPYGGIVIVWRIAHHLLGYGVSGIGLLVDPMHEPLRYLATILENFPIFMLAQWAFPPADVGIFLPPRYILWLSIVGGIFTLILIWVLMPLLKRDRVARFWLVGMLLSLLPVSTSFLMDRHLFFVGFGAMGLLAQWLRLVFGDVERRPPQLLWRIPAKIFGILFVTVHLIIAPLALPLRAANPIGYTKQINQMHVPILTDPAVENQDVIIVNPPFTLVALYLPILQELEGQPVPAHTRVLAPGYAPVTVHRTDERTLVVRPEYGFLAFIMDRTVRSDSYPMAVGEKVELTGMTATVLEISDNGRLTQAEFRFDRSLEDPSLRWFKWEKGKYTPFTPPLVGEKVILNP